MGAEVEQPKKDGSTALLIASLNGHVEVVRFLCDSRAEMNTPNQEGLTPLAAALMFERNEVLEHFMQRVHISGMCAEDHDVGLVQIAPTVDVIEDVSDAIAPTSSLKLHLDPPVRPD